MEVSILNQKAQQLRLAAPLFSVVETRGPPHAPLFRMAVDVHGRRFEMGAGQYAASQKQGKAMVGGFLGEGVIAAVALAGLAWLPQSSLPAPPAIPLLPPPSVQPPPQTTPLANPPPNPDATPLASVPAEIPIAMPIPVDDSTDSAISRLYERAKLANTPLTDIYNVAGTGAFQCHFMWGTKQMPTSVPHSKKQSAKNHAAQLALASLALANNPFPTPQQPLTPKTTPPTTTPTITTTTPIAPSTPPLAQSDPILALMLFLRTQPTLASSPAIYTEIASPSGFQYTVALESGRVIATSDMFVKKVAAKRHAAALALLHVQRKVAEQQQQQQQRRTDSSAGGSEEDAEREDGEVVEKKQKRALDTTSSVASVDYMMLMDSENESLLDVWEKEVRAFGSGEGDQFANGPTSGSGASVLGATRDMRKCTNNIVASVCLALQGYEGLRVDRVVVGGAFGRGTIVLFDYSVEIILLRNPPPTQQSTPPVVAPPSTDEPTPAVDSTPVVEKFSDLVASALTASPISTSIQQMTELDAKNGGGVKVWYNGIQSIRFKVRDGITFLQPLTGNEFLESTPRLKQITQHSVALMKVKELVAVRGVDKMDDLESWTPSFAETSQLFFRNHAHAAIVARVLKYWVVPLNLSTSDFERVCIALELVAVHAFDDMERVVNYDANKLSILLALEYALKSLENWRSMRIFWTEFYTRSEIHPSRFLHSSPPFLMDPVNACYNLFDTVDLRVWEAMGIFAKDTRVKIFEQ
ncbi:hypothetical protein HDU98_001820, partial [Podochytrium sp. JEL0797]